MADDARDPTGDPAEAWRRLDPVKPLASDSPWYVDCAAERGIHNFVDRMVQAITWATPGGQGSSFVHDLVVGHRGSGKSTELLRLKARLERAGFYVHYVDLASEMEVNDIDTEAVLTILLRRLVLDLNKIGISLKTALVEDVAEWFGTRVKTAVGERASQIEIAPEARLGAAGPLVSLFARFTGFMRWGTRTEDKLTIEYARYLSDLRERVDPLLIDANLKLQKRPESPKGLVILADSLDHITLPARQDEVFIDSADILCRLSTHLLLTMPSGLLATGRGDEVEACFRKCHWLPIVKVRTVKGDSCPAGLDKMREIISRRCDLSLFDEKALERICTYSGGHARHLIRLAQDAIADAVTPPVPLDSANRAVASLSNTLATGRTPDEWKALAATERNPLSRPFSEDGRRLLFHDCLLTYENAQEMDDECIPSQWYAVHPALRRVKAFTDAREA